MNIENKIRSGQFIIDEENNQFTMLDTRFYSPDGGETFLPSVTSILNCYPKSEEFLRWLKENGSQADEIRDNAASHGSAVHNLVDRFLNGETISMVDADGKIRYSSAEWAQFERFVFFYRRFNLEVIQNEFNIISPKLGFAGTIDLVANLDGKRIMIDLKTSKAIHNTYFLQLAAYKRLYDEVFPDAPLDSYAVLWLNAKTRGVGRPGQYQDKGIQLVFPEKEDAHYWRLFRATHALYLEEYADAKPNNIVYNLEHKK